MRKPVRVLFLAVLAFALGTSSSRSAPGGCTNAQWLLPFDFETITVSSTSIGFTSATWAPPGQPVADMAVVTLASNDVRYRADGVAPTAAVGHVLASGGSVTACGAQSLNQVRFIRVTSDGTLSVSYYRQVNP